MSSSIKRAATSSFVTAFIAAHVFGTFEVITVAVLTTIGFVAAMIVLAIFLPDGVGFKLACVEAAPVDLDRCGDGKFCSLLLSTCQRFFETLKTAAYAFATNCRNTNGRMPPCW